MSLSKGIKQHKERDFFLNREIFRQLIIGYLKFRKVFLDFCSEVEQQADVNLTRCQVIGYCKLIISGICHPIIGVDVADI